VTIHRSFAPGRAGYCAGQKSVQITEPMENLGTLQPLARALNRIDGPSARKIVIMSKWQRGELCAADAGRLIRLCQLEGA
jgi:hypothetical protein